MLLTVITPTYNRAHLLERCYESLINQTDKDIEWLVIDDGSTDGTKDIMKDLINKNQIKIRYFFKENGGKHTALNIGFKEAQGVLSLILDSDDILTLDAVESIRKKWEIYKDSKGLSSLVFLRKYSNGQIIGQSFPKNLKYSNHIDIAINNQIKGDKCEVYITDILKQYQFPVFENEKFMGESVVWIEMGRQYGLVCINKPIYETEYLEGGLTLSGRKLRIQCPLGGRLLAKKCMKKDIKFIMRLKNSILYNTYSLFAQKSFIEIIKENDYRLLTITGFIPGYLLYKFWRRRYK